VIMQRLNIIFDLFKIIEYKTWVVNKLQYGLSEKLN